MKKLFVLMTVLALGVAAEMSAGGRLKKHVVSLDAPCITCEKEEMIKVCAEPEVISGYRCPAGFETIE